MVASNNLWKSYQISNFHPPFLVWYSITCQKKCSDRNQGCRSHSGCTDFFNVETVMSWHLPLTALFCMSVLCLLKSHRGQTCDDFRWNAVTVLRTSPQASQKLFPLRRKAILGRQIKRRKLQGVKTCCSCWKLVPFLPVYGFTSANPASALGFTGRLNSLWPGPSIFPLILI